jgi:hypothetical protein
VSGGDIHYPKYELYNNGQYKYSTQPQPQQQQQRECQYTTKYGEDCYFSSSKYATDQPSQSAQQQPSSGQSNKTWPKQRLQHDEAERVYTQDDQRVQYLQEQLEAETSRLLLRGEDNREPRYSSSSKKRTKQQQQQHYSSRDKSPSDYPSSSAAAVAHYNSAREREREYLVSTGESKHYLQQVTTQQNISDL